jgi:hypothetical protein
MDAMKAMNNKSSRKLTRQKGKCMKQRSRNSNLRNKMDEMKTEKKYG